MFPVITQTAAYTTITPYQSDCPSDGDGLPPLRQMPPPAAPGPSGGRPSSVANTDDWDDDWDDDSDADTQVGGPAGGGEAGRQMVVRGSAGDVSNAGQCPV